MLNGTKKKKESFLNGISHGDINDKLNELTQKVNEAKNGEMLEDSLSDFTNILLGAGSDHIKEVKISLGSNKTKSKVAKAGASGAQWYDKECYDQSKIFREFELRYYDTELEQDRVNMCEQRSRYRKLCRDKKREFEQQKAEKLVKLSKSKPKEFWKEIKGDKKKGEVNQCNFYEHFKNLANIESRVGEEGRKEIENEKVDNLPQVDMLDKSIEMKELDVVLKSLKRNKCSGPDKILNEFLINANTAVKLFILLLFNKILEIEYFPEVWAIGRVFPVYKKGDKTDENNYRGITVISCLGKVFTKIMNNRLNQWAEENGKLSNVQYGFRKERSTVDCLFIIQGLIDILFSRGLKLYACFIDYEKAYDLIDRACLFHKLIKIGISSKCINIFRNMYSKMKLSVDTDENNRFFSSNVGLLQGEITSPLLFSFFVSDLEEGLSNEFIGIDVVNVLIKILMFADDMVIFSTTISGLQKGLDNLYNYCKKWGMKLNILKTKIVVFKRGGKISKEEKWNFNDHVLEVVTSFKYLGCFLSSSGSFTDCLTDLVGSARRALFGLKRYFKSNSETLPETQLDLFSSMVSPILNYGSEVWGLRKADLIETFHLSFLKSILGVKTSTPNCFIYGELGVYPLIIERKTRVIKYWLKIIRTINDNENYVHKIYKELLTINELHPTRVTWVSQTKLLLQQCGFGYIWENQAVDNENYFLSQFKRRLTDMYLQEWHTQVEITSDNRLYKHIKSKFKIENYLKINNKSLRTSISKIRLSSHSFNIERGRWGPNKLLVDDRRCEVCNIIESEYHTLIKCPRFNNDRQGLLTSDLMKDPSFFNFLKYIKSENIYDLKKLGLLCSKILKEYREYL